MIAAEKQQKADFLALARDFLSSGYRTERKDYHFEDDNAAAENPQTEIAENHESFQEVETDTIEKIAEEIRACVNCPLAKTRENTAPGEGAQNPLVLVVGEGPGEEEDKQGRPFVGKAGQLDKMLGSINLSRNTNCFIANVIKCRPPNNRDPLPEEAAACAHFLERQIALLKPKYILAVGRVAAQALLKTEEALGKLRGKNIELDVRGVKYPLFITYHPSALLRNEALKRPTWEDLKLLRAILDKMEPVGKLG